MFSLVKDSGFFDHISKIEISELPSSFFDFLDDDGYVTNTFRLDNDDTSNAAVWSLLSVMPWSLQPNLMYLIRSQS